MSKLSEQQREDLISAMSQPDESIDLSDIPEIKAIPPDAVRGKFYRPGAVMHIPVYLDQTVQEFLLKKARDKGIPFEQLVNDLLKRDIETFQSLA